MILVKYINREIILTGALVTMVLAIILLGGRLLMYLGYAAEGRLLASLVFRMVLYRSPEFLQMIIPLGFFMGILLALGRMSIERELAVIEGAGKSLTWIGLGLMPLIILLTALVMMLSVYLGPLGVQQTDLLFEKQQERSQVSTLAPKRFHTMSNGQGVIYVNNVMDGLSMHDIFLANVEKDNTFVVLAGRGKREVFAKEGEEFIQLIEGQRYDVQPGTSTGTIIEFNGYRAKINQPDARIASTRVKGAKTLSLLQQDDWQARAELHWRLGLPLLIPNVALLALALCRVNPRQGRFLRLFPAIAVYLLYLGFAMVFKAQVEKHGMLALVGYWSLHGIMFVVGVVGLRLSDRGRL